MRLGGSVDDVEEIKKHPFFRDLDWTHLMLKKVDPVYEPAVDEDESILLDKSVQGDSYVLPSPASGSPDGSVGFTFASDPTAMSLQGKSYK